MGLSGVFERPSAFAGKMNVVMGVFVWYNGFTLF